MSNADIQYNSLLQTILDDGKSQTPDSVRAQWADGTPAIATSVLNKSLSFDGSEVPIITSKRVYWKTAIKEMLWIWQKKSNVVADLRAMGVQIWNKWEIQEGPWKGTIGPAYGYQLAKKCRTISDGQVVDQVDYLLHSLKTNPQSRRNLTNLWETEYLDAMALTPCVWNTQWTIWDNKLHLTVNIRSNDMCVGNPFNVFQYYVLQRMVSQVTAIPCGTIHFNIVDAHIYNRHCEEAARQLTLPVFDAPELIIDPTITNFYDFKIEHFQLKGYQWSDEIAYELAE